MEPPATVSIAGMISLFLKDVVDEEQHPGAERFEGRYGGG
jgi:hypothetical protein